MKRRVLAYVDLDVLVLEVESVLPDINADNGDKVEQRVLVGGGGNLQTLGGGVEALSSRKLIMRMLR